MASRIWHSYNTDPIYKRVKRTDTGQGYGAVTKADIRPVYTRLKKTDRTGFQGSQKT